MTFIVRASTRDDLAAVDALLARAYPRLLKPDYPPSVLVTALPLISRAQPALLSSGTYYVAEDDNATILGAGGWTPDRNDRRVGHIRHVVTDDRAVRQGVGRSILSHAFERAAAAGVRRLVSQSTRTAVPFYSAMGFESLGPVEVELRPGIVFPAIRMVRSL